MIAESGRVFVVARGFSATKPVHSGPREHPVPSSAYHGFSRGQSGRVVALTAHHNQTPCLGKSAVALHIPLYLHGKLQGSSVTHIIAKKE